MRGCVTRRSSGAYSFVVELGRNAEGKRRQRTKGGYRTKREAQDALAQVMHELQSGTYVAPTKITVTEHLRQWLEASRANLSARTYERYQIIVECHLIPALGHLRLIDLRPAHIAACYAAALKDGRKHGNGGLSTSTVRKHHVVLHKALRQAVRFGLLAQNPADAVEAPVPKPRRAQALTSEQTVRLLHAAQGGRLYLPILVAVTTGLRRGELLALRWGDIDLQAALLCVRQALEETGHALGFKEPKTAKSRRSVVLPQTTVAALRRHKAEQDERRLRLGASYRADLDLVFALPDGGPWWPSDFERCFRTFRDRLGMAVRFHDLRHTHATALLMQGVHPKVVSERLGHSTIAITMDIYSHVLPGLQEQAVAAYDETLRGALSGVC